MGSKRCAGDVPPRSLRKASCWRVPHARTANLRFDIDLLAERVVAATDWLIQGSDIGQLPIGHFGAAATFVAAANRPDVVGAIVSRGGVPT
jgi:hypothetical protein